MCKKICILITAIVLIIVFAIPLGIASIVLTKNPSDGNCQFDNLDEKLGYDLPNFIFGVNIAAIVIVLIIMILLLFLIFLRKIPLLGSVIVVFASWIIAFLWISLAIEFFINRGSACTAHVIVYFGYSAVLLILSAVTLIFIIKC